MPGNTLKVFGFQLIKADILILPNKIIYCVSSIFTGKGGNSIWGKKFEDEFKETLKHSERGIVSMANNGPNTNASQFFITYAAHPHLDLKYTVFGQVIDGFETLDNLEKLPVNSSNHKPIVDTKLNSITIHANPMAG